MKRFLSFLILACALGSSVSGLDVRDGRMRLVVDERSGRFALYFLADVTKNRYVPLLYDQETRTTYPTLLVDQKAYRLGDSPEFRTTVGKDASGNISIEYRSSFCVVRQSFSFTTSTGATLSDGITIGATIENVSQKDSALGFRYLFDTWLGEKAGTHFIAQSGVVLNTEVMYGADSTEQWIRSPGDAGASLQVSLSAPATRPDRVVAANWKRLNDAPWTVEANPSRNFTLLPYSVNDSALALYYDPVVVRPGASRTIATILGNETTGPQRAAVIAPQASAGSIAAADSAPLDAMADLIAVRSVLDAIDAALSSGSALTPEDQASLEATLKRLEARKVAY
jgi:hypothetical protein